MNMPNLKDSFPKGYAEPRGCVEPQQDIASWHIAKVGEVCSETHLAINGGKFYDLDGVKHCDMPTATFKSKTPGHFERIE